MGNDLFGEGDVIVRERRVDEEKATDLDPAGEKLARGFVGDNTTKGPAWCRCQSMDDLEWKERRSKGVYIPPSMSDGVSEGERDEMYRLAICSMLPVCREAPMKSGSLKARTLWSAD